MDRPDLREVLNATQKAMAQIDEQLAKAQALASHSRFSVMMAVEMNTQANTLDQVIKTQIYTEAMGHVFARIIESRTHLEVALRALTEPSKGT